MNPNTIVILLVSVLVLKNFAWVFPNEQIQGRTMPKHGAFVYLFHEIGAGNAADNGMVDRLFPGMSVLFLINRIL